MADRMDKYEPIKVLGEGSFGKVYLMRQLTERKLVCVKVIRVKNIPRKEREACKMEVDLLKRLVHPNIVGYRESFMHQNKESLCIVMQYCDGGDLCARIKAAKNKLFPESKILHWFVQMALGLHYMHEERVLHRDLKTQNIFMLGNGRLVLGDLGISKVLEGTMDFASTCIGTPYYMSPEIFKDKPYNHKSDIWALGCVLYEMTTLKYAFDAQSYNGLACKIIKGKYPPCDPKYSRHLRELIAAMLSTSPSARPDLPVILSKPFIKHHIKGFFADVASRPETAMGEGTLVMHSAASNIAAELSGQKPTHSSSPEMKSLVHQLQTLKLDSVMAEALGQSIPNSARSNKNRVGGGDARDRQVKRKAREQASALQREEERRQAVAAALERLRDDRVKRGADAAELRRKQRERDAQRAGGAGRYVPGQRGYERNRNLPAANERGRQRQAEPKVAAPVSSNVRNQRDRERRRVSELDSWENQHVGGGGGGNRNDNYRMNDAPRPGRRERSASNDSRSDDHNNELLDERNVAKAAAEARQLERREKERERERNRQRAEIEKLKEAKLELDRRDGERRARHDKAENRVGSDKRWSNFEAKEGSSPERIVVRDALPRTPVDKHHVSNVVYSGGIDHEDNGQTARNETLLVGTRQQGTLMYPATLEYQQTQFRNQPTDRFSNNTLQQQTLYEDSKASSSSSSSTSTAERGSLMNARERMLARKAERADEAREARMQELRESGAEQASVRAQAKDQERRLYTSTFDNVRKQEKESSDTTVEAKSSVKDPLNDPLGMNADELLAKLSEADNGGKRYEIQSQDILNPHSRQSSGSPLANNNNNNGGVGGGYLEDDSVHVDSDDLLGSDSDDVSEFGSEDEGWARPEVREDGIDDAEEDIKAHEEELKAELEAATLRCQSLRRTLVQTKSMLRMKEKENSPMRSPGLLQPDEVIVEDAVEVDDDDIDDDDIEDDDESNGIDEEEEEEEELRANSSLIREATGMGPQLKQLNIPPPSYPVTPKRKPSAEPRPSPELSDMPSPKGRLADRISVLRQRCVEGLGQSKFDAAHSYLKQIQDAQDIGYEMGGENMVEEEEDEATQQRRLTSILGHDMVHYSSLIEQLIFMEDTLLD